MNHSRQDDHWAAAEVPLPLLHVIEAAEAIREATFRMQRLRLAPRAFEPLDAHSLAAVGAAFEDITGRLAQFAGDVARALPDSVDQDLTVSQQIHDGLVAFRIAVLDASVAARALESSATAVTNGAVTNGAVTNGAVTNGADPRRCGPRLSR